MQLRTIDLTKARGLGDKALGFGKELVGTLTGNDALQEAGEAQQEKATEELRALRAEAKAQAKEAKADVHEQRQKAAQTAKG
ncbi:MAG: CsbD family protein [Acidimicrobiales bacterium]